MLWLAAHFPLLGFEVQRGDEAGRPAVLVRDNRVVQADDLALQAGVAVGSTLATAHSIASGLLHFQHDADLVAKRLEVLGQATYRFSSQVSLALPDALLIEGSGSLALFGGDQAFRKAVSRLYEHLEHAHRLATAPTPLAALILARADYGERPGDPMTTMRTVPVAALDLADKEQERLANMGIRRVGQLLELPTDELGKRFSAELIDTLHRLTGRRADPRDSIAPAERFHARLHLPEPIRDKNALLFPMRRLADQLAHWLQARCLGTGRLIWTYAPFAGPALKLEVHFASPRTDAKAFLALTRLQLEGAQLPEEVLTVSLQAGRIAPLSPASTDLLALADDRGASTTELVDRLAAKLGTEAVVGIAHGGRPSPRTRLALASPCRPSAPRASPAEANRPLWLLDPPRPVDAERFDLLDGPERIDVGWWGGRRPLARTGVLRGNGPVRRPLLAVPRPRTALVSARVRGMTVGRRRQSGRRCLVEPVERSGPVTHPLAVRCTMRVSSTPLEASKPMALSRPPEVREDRSSSTSGPLPRSACGHGGC